MRVGDAVRRTGPGEHRQIVDRVAECDRSQSAAIPCVAAKSASIAAFDTPLAEISTKLVAAAVAGRHSFADHRIRPRRAARRNASSDGVTSSFAAGSDSSTSTAAINVLSGFRPAIQVDSVPVRSGRVARSRTRTSGISARIARATSSATAGSIKRVRIALRRSDVVQNGAVGNNRDTVLADQVGQVVQPARWPGGDHHENTSGAAAPRAPLVGSGPRSVPSLRTERSVKIGGDQAGGVVGAVTGVTISPQCLPRAVAHYPSERLRRKRSDVGFRSFLTYLIELLTTSSDRYGRMLQRQQVPLRSTVCA